MEPARKQTCLRWLSFGLYSALVALLSLGPDSSMRTPRIPHADKLAHFGMYFLQAALLHRAMNRDIRTHRAIVAVILICGGYGLIMEYGQLVLTTAGRSCEWQDAIANIAGAVVGAFLIDWHRARLMAKGNTGCITNLERS
jgi:VanZ family protein